MDKKKRNISSNHAQVVPATRSTPLARAKAERRRCDLRAHLRGADMEGHQPRGRIGQHVEVRSGRRAHRHGTAFWIHLVVNEAPLLQKSMYSMEQHDRLQFEELKPCSRLTWQKGDGKDMLLDQRQIQNLL